MNTTLPLSRSLLISGLVAIGIASAWFMLAVWMVGVAESVAFKRTSYENIYTTVSGEPVLARTTSGNLQTTEKILSLAGEPVNVTSQDLLYPQTVDGPDRQTANAKTPEWMKRLAAANDGGVPPIYWYMVHDGQNPGHAYGVGFHGPTQTIVGYFGRSGFGESLPPRDQWFDIPGHSGMSVKTNIQFYGQEPRWTTVTSRGLLLADGKLWRIDFVKKQLTRLLDCPEAYRLGQAWRILDRSPPQAPESDRHSASSITPLDGLVREPESVLIVNTQSGASKRFPLPAEIRSHMLAAAHLPDGNLLLTARRSYRDSEEHVVWLTPSGEIAKQQTVHIKAQWQSPSVTSLGWMAAIGAPSPLVNAAVTLGWLPNAAVENEQADDYSQAMSFVLRRTWPSMLAVFALGCAMVPLAYGRQKRFGLPNPEAWAVFVFLFGVPGWIAYRFHRTWPVLEECPSCRQPSPRDREDCLDCGKTFPPPPLKGIEVFA